MAQAASASGSVRRMFLDAHDLVDVEVRLLEDERHTAAQGGEAHAPASTASAASATSER